MQYIIKNVYFPDCKRVTKRERRAKDKREKKKRSEEDKRWRNGALVRHLIKKD